MLSSFGWFWTVLDGLAAERDIKNGLKSYHTAYIYVYVGVQSVYLCLYVYITLYIGTLAD